jgi:MFS family permease
MREEAIQFFSNLSIFATTTFIPIIAVLWGADPFTTAMIIVAYNTAVFLSNYACGRWADMYGRRNFLLGGLMLSSVAFALHIFIRDIVSLTVIRVFAGLAIGMWGPALLAYVFEADKKLGKIMGYGGLGWGMGILFSGIMAIFWSTQDLYIRMYVVSTVGLVLSTIIAMTLPKLNEVKLVIPLFPVKVIKKSLPAYLAVVIRHTGATAVWSLLPYYLETHMHFGMDTISYIYASNAFIQFIVMYYVDKVPSRTAIISGLFISIFAFFFFLWATSPWHWAFLFIVFGGAWSLLYVGATVYVMERNVERATSTGLLQGSTNLAGITGPLIGGLIVLVAPFWWNFVLATVLSIVALIIFIGMAKPPMPRIGRARKKKTTGQSLIPGADL